MHTRDYIRVVLDKYAYSSQYLLVVRWNLLLAPTPVAGPMVVKNKHPDHFSRSLLIVYGERSCLFGETPPYKLFPLLVCFITATKPNKTTRVATVVVCIPWCSSSRSSIRGIFHTYYQLVKIILLYQTSQYAYYELVHCILSTYYQSTLVLYYERSTLSTLVVSIIYILRIILVVRARILYIMHYVYYSRVEYQAM